MRFIGSGEKRNKPKFRLRLFLFYFTFWGFSFIPLILEFGQVFSTSASLLQSEPKNNDFFFFVLLFRFLIRGILWLRGCELSRKERKLTTYVSGPQ